MVCDEENTIKKTLHFYNSWMKWTSTNENCEIEYDRNQLASTTEPEPVIFVVITGFPL